VVDDVVKTHARHVAVALLGVVLTYRLPTKIFRKKTFLERAPACVTKARTGARPPSGPNHNACALAVPSHRRGALGDVGDVGAL